MTDPNFTSAIILNTQKQLLMVLAQGSNDDHPYWTLPGGRVEHGETATQALVREVHEETGLHIVHIGQLAYAVSMQFDDILTRAEVYEIGAYRGDLCPNDPDGKIHEVAWLALDAALQHLQVLDFAPMSQPAIAYLSRQAAAGHHWSFRVDGEGKPWVHNSG